MKTLFLLRHAKSSRNDATLSDFERPLNRRGQRAAKLIGRFLRQQEISPDLVLSSPAVRARDTVEGVLQAAKLRTEVRFDERIYEASPATLLEAISQIEGQRNRVLLVGHNPGLEGLIQVLTNQAERMPTAALVQIDLNISKWQTVLRIGGELCWMVRPKELDD